MRLGKGLPVLVAAVLCVVGVPAAWSAPAPVEDISGGRPPPQSGDSGVSMLFAQLQILQEEVRELRGQLEEQTHQLKRLEQQQKDNYLDLDGRLSALTTGEPAAGPASAGLASAGEAVSAQPGPEPTQPGPEAVQSEPERAADPELRAQPPGSAVGGGVTQATGDKAAYDQAYELLKQGRMDDALAGFESFTRDFPDSGLLANAVYWMGEIYLVQNDQQAAIERFSRVAEAYPAHQKAADAHYKLGTLYLQLGDKAQARAHLERAALAGGSVAVLAKRYLETHF